MFVATESAALKNRARAFDLARDAFAYRNELFLEYRFDPATGRTLFTRCKPVPTYAHRCFVLISAARKFLYHAHFDPEKAVAPNEDYRRLIRRVMRRNPRRRAKAGHEILIPGYSGLHDFSRAHPDLLKAGCGGAWRSYILRSHWRMVIPISRAHQAQTAQGLRDAIQRDGTAVIHLVRFPALTINHGMLLFKVHEIPNGLEFEAYDPNEPAQPATLTYHEASWEFSLPANRYWAGGRLDIIHIFQNWWL